MVEQKVNQPADANTALIHNCWYVAATSDEVGDALMDRWILKLPVLLYRTSDGRVAALDNRCPHRAFPLSAGRRVGDSVACGYHGMEFDPAGRCVNVPMIARTPGNLKVRAFPVVERAPLVWIWMGDPDLADESLIPPHLPVAEAGWTAISGYCHVDANYVGLQENLQDLSHFEHLHTSSIGVPSRDAAAMTVDTTDDAIHSERVYENVPAPPLHARLLDLKGNRITRVIREAFYTPAHCEAFTTFTDVARDPGEPRDFHLRILHFITPEHQRSTHYFWFVARDFAIDDESASEELRTGIGGAFAEDKQALELIDTLTRTDERHDLREMSFTSDKAGILMRRRIAQLAAREDAAHA